VMDQLPASWALLPVSGVVRNITLTDKKIPQKKYLPGGKFPVFDQGQEYLGGYTDDAEMLVDCVLPVIVFGDHTRVVKLVNTAFAPGADGVKVLQPSACILPKLLEHFVRYLVTKIPNNGYARHYQHLAKSLLPIPPLAEQHRIVAKIEELFSELDQGVASLKTAREQLKAYRQSLLKNAFEGKLTAAWRAAHTDQIETAAALQQRIARERTDRHRQQLADWQASGQPGPKPKPHNPLPPLTPEELAELPELPAGWGRTYLASVATVLSGYAFKSADFETEGVPVIKIANVGYSQFVTKDQEFLATSFLKTYSPFTVRAGDFLIALTRPITNNQTKVCRYPAGAEPALLNQRVAVLKDVDVDEEYFFAFLNSSIFKELIRSKFSETLQPNLSPKDLEIAHFPVCSLTEQREIVQELESKLSEADQLDQTLATALQQAEALRQSILKKAFHGQLVKQDKNEEPASALLERIRAEKLNVTKKPSKREKSS
jgi:type I restriction enzyme S subunit